MSEADTHRLSHTSPASCGRQVEFAVPPQSHPHYAAIGQALTDAHALMTAMAFEPTRLTVADSAVQNRAKLLYEEALLYATRQQAQCETDLRAMTRGDGAAVERAVETSLPAAMTAAALPTSTGSSSHYAANMQVSSSLRSVAGGASNLPGALAVSAALAGSHATTHGQASTSSASDTFPPAGAVLVGSSDEPTHEGGGSAAMGVDDVANSCHADMDYFLDTGALDLLMDEKQQQEQ